MTDIQKIKEAIERIEGGYKGTLMPTEDMLLLLSTAQAHIELLEEVDKLRVQLAGCGVAAFGYAKDEKGAELKKGDYGWSASYQDVKDLWEKYNTLTSKISKERIIKALYKWDDRWLLCWDGEGEGEAFDCGCCLDNGQHSEKCRCHCHPRERKLSEAIYNDLIGGIIA
jgi:hypothetical protein